MVLLLAQQITPQLVECYICCRPNHCSNPCYRSRRHSNNFPETIHVTLTSPTNATILTPTGTGTIDDIAPTISINNPTFVAPLTGSATDDFTVTLSAASNQAVTVNYNTANGTAMSPGDYTAANGTVTFAPGQTSEQIAVVIQGNAANTSSETMEITLNNSSHATIVTPIGTGTIVYENQPQTNPPVDNMPTVVVKTTPPLVVVPIIPQHDVIMPVSETPISVIPIITPRDTASPIIGTPKIDLSDFDAEIIVTPVRQIDLFTSDSDSDNIEATNRIHAKIEKYLLEGTFNIFLTNRPIAPVIINLTSQDIPNDMVFPHTVIFTQDNWNIPQEVTVKVPTTFDHHDSNVIHIKTLPAESDDPHYNGYQPASVEIILPDNGQIGNGGAMPIESHDKPTTQSQPHTQDTNTSSKAQPKEDHIDKAAE